MKSYKLLTPGPLTTTQTVKEEMLFDHCTWDDDYKQITQQIRKDLLALGHVSEPDYTVVLMQGSGTFGVESVISSIVQGTDRILVCTNGEYGKRMVEICRYHGLDYVEYAASYDTVPAAAQVESYLIKDPTITHIAMVHSETTTGILNDLDDIGSLCAAHGKTFIVDAMSSFGGIEMDIAGLHIDFLISSANKCIQGVPGFSFVIANREKLEASKGTARSLSLDLYDQWLTMQKDGKWRYTSPTHVVLAFAKAIAELKAEGGIPAREARYRSNNALLIGKMKEMGMPSYIDAQHQSPIITSFYYPEGDFSFEEMYHYIKERGYAIYPGKLTDADTFRVGNIGEIYEADIRQLCGIIQSYLEEKRA